MDSELPTLKREKRELKLQLAIDPYEKLEELGAGGFCTVSRATRCVDDGYYVEVCLKELKPKLREDPDSVRYFRREAHIASNLRHRNIVRLIDVDFPRYRLIYELVDGVDLRRLLTQAGGRLEPDLVIVIGLEIASALEYAHSRTRDDMPAGVIHRDLKPANVLISEEGQVVLADFGAAAVESSELPTSVRGTAAYMSPEQSRGRPVDAGTDLFSLGVMLYELVAGRRPFDGDREGPASFERLHRGEYPSLSSLAPRGYDALVAIIDRLLRPNRDERYGGAIELVSALATIAPNREVVRSLGSLSRAARRRQPKSYDKLQAPRTFQLQSSELLSDTSSAVDDALTLLRATVPSDNVPANQAVSSPSRVKSRMLVAAFGGVLFSTLYFVLPEHHSWSSLPADAFRGVDAPSLAKATELPAASASTSESGEPATPPATDVLAVPDESRSHENQDSGDAAAHLEPAKKATETEPSSPKSTLTVGADMSAPVWVDGHFIGWSPAYTRVDPGSHAIVIGRGERQQTLKTMVSAGRPSKIFVNVRQPIHEHQTTDVR